jgi:hypothetical protein
MATAFQYVAASGQRFDIIFDQHNLVINGVISLPIAVLAYFFLPDTPGTAKPNWIFTERVRFRIS